MSIEEVVTTIHQKLEKLPLFRIQSLKKCKTCKKVGTNHFFTNAECIKYIHSEEYYKYGKMGNFDIELMTKIVMRRIVAMASDTKERGIFQKIKDTFSDVYDVATSPVMACNTAGSIAYASTEAGLLATARSGNWVVGVSALVGTAAFLGTRAAIEKLTEKQYCKVCHQTIKPPTPGCIPISDKPEAHVLL